MADFIALHWIYGDKMIDNAKLEGTIQKSIEQAIQKLVAEDFSNDLRQSQINNVIQKSVEKVTKELLANDASRLQKIIIDNIKTNSELTNTILQQSIPHLKENIDKKFPESLKEYFDNEMSSAGWQSNIQKTINQTVSRFSSELFSKTDNDKLISDTIERSLRLNNKEVRSAFSGIQDNSHGDVQLVVMPDYVVVENELYAKKITSVEGIEAKSLSVKDLSVTGSINVDNASWENLRDEISSKTEQKLGEKFVSDITETVLKTAKRDGIEFSNVKIGNKPVVDGNVLSDSITESNIQKIGSLKNLRVTGNADIHDTLHVVNGRIGINTDTPDMALNVWDGETTISVGKMTSKRAFIGTTRRHEVALGVNGQGDVVIDSDGNTTIKSLKVGKHKIGHADQVPGWSGTKGDFIINSSPGKDGVFAWICLGDYRWKALKAA